MQIGRAVDTLRTELPQFFTRGLVDYTIYSPQIILNEPEHYRFYVRGLRWYQLFMAGTRRVMRWYFDGVCMDVKSISHGVDNTLNVHWVVQGTSRSSILKSVLGGDGFVERSVYEGLFVYRFDGHGRICEHSIQKIMPAPKQFAPLRAISWLQQQKIAVESNVIH
jgi:hypothetical protein